MIGTRKEYDNILRLKVPLLLIALVIVCQSCIFWRGEGAVACGKEHKLEIVSLAIYPDPLPESRRIDQWRVRIRSDAPKECQTTIRIVEAGTSDPITQEKLLILSPSVNDISLSTAESYRLTGKEQCFEAVIDRDGSKRPVDSPQKWCARLVDGRWWSMR